MEKTTKEVLHKVKWEIHGPFDHATEIHPINDPDGLIIIADVYKPEDAELICKAVNERQKLIEALKAFHAMFIHVEGEPAKNKIKTDMIKHCEEVKEALNNSRSILYHATNE